MHTSIVPSTSDNSLATSATMQAMGGIGEQFTKSNGFSKYQSKKSESTRRAHQDDLKTFSRFLETFAESAGLDADTPTPDALYGHAAAWQDVTYGIVDMFVEWMKVEGYSLASMNRKLATVRLYCNKSAELGHLAPEAAAAIRGLKIASGAREVVEIDEDRIKNGHSTRRSNQKVAPVFCGPEVMQRLRDNHEDTPVGRRNRLIMTLLVEWGLRVSEVAGLTIGDIDIAANKIHVYRKKTVLHQNLTMEPVVRDAVLACLADVATDGPEAPLVRGSHKGGVITCKGISTRSIARIVKRLGEDNDVEGLSPHDLRHSWTKINMERVMDLPRGKDSIRVAGGWKTMSMVDHYDEEIKIANEGMGSILD